MSWSLVAAAFAFIGLTHAYQLTGNNIDFLFIFSEPADEALSFRANGIAIGYLLFAAVFAAFGVLQTRRSEISSSG